MSTMGNLRPELTTLIGRESEVRDVRASLRRTRLTTLTGPGGVGKTRLALRVGHSLLSTFRHGVWFVELAPIRDPDLVEPAIAATLGLADGRVDAPGMSVGDKLASWEALLILDNCEHLLDACATTVENLLTVAFKLRIVATSREPLAVAGEQVIPVQTLPTPPVERVARPAQVSQYASVQLLAERARAVAPTFAVDDDNVEAVVSLVDQLDGLPLAIELAAARLRSLSAGDIVRRLDNRYRLFSSPARGAPERHHDVDSLVGWSYALCTTAGRRLWEQMTVFAGPADLDAVEAVCRGPGLNVYILAELVDTLVSKSILIRTSTDKHYYHMLGMVHEYGRAKLAEHGEANELFERHAAYYCELVSDFAAAWFGPDQSAWCIRIRTNLPNIRASMDYYLGAGCNPEIAAIMAVELWRLWLPQGLIREGRLRMQQVLDATPPGVARRKAMWVLGWTEILDGHMEQAVSLLGHCAAEAAAHGDAEALDYSNTLLAGAYAFEGQLDLAKKHITRGLEGRRDSRDTTGWAIALFIKGEIHWARLEFDQALECGVECERLCGPFGEHWVTSYGLSVQSLACYGLGDYTAAIELAQRSIRAKQALHDTVGVLLAAEVVCWASAAEGDVRLAAKLEAAMEPLWATTCAPLMGFDRLVAERDQSNKRIRSALGEHRYERIRRSTSEISLEHVVELALIDADLREPTSKSDFNTVALPLTERELQVASLIAEGLTNKEVASRLVVARKTVDTHVANVMRKLEINSRVQIATWYTALGSR